jgi:hypothetical protein
MSVVFCTPPAGKDSAMKKNSAVLSFLFLGLALVLFMSLRVCAAFASPAPAVPAVASSPAQFQQAPAEGKGCTVPKTWGTLKGVAERSIAFEDSAGTIRVIDIGPCMRGQTQLIVEINRP